MRGSGCVCMSARACLRSCVDALTGLQVCILREHTLVCKLEYVSVFLACAHMCMCPGVRL